MKILVTGGAGYIGSVLTNELLKLNFKVTVIDNFIFNQSSLLDLAFNKNLTIIKEDIRNLNILKKEIKKSDVIIPLAGIVGAKACDRDKKLTYEINVEHSKNIIKFSGKKPIIFPVTNSGYGIGKKNKFCDESSPLNPVSYYGKTKVMAEKIIMKNKSAICLRLATVFGSSPRMRTDLLVNNFVLKAFLDKYIVLFESGFKRNFIHVRDVCSAIIHSIHNYNKMKNNIYNVGLSSANLSKKELCIEIKKIIKDFIFVDSKIGKDPDKRDYIVSNKKIEKTGWRPKFDLKDGIIELIKIYNFLQVSKFDN